MFIPVIKKNSSDKKEVEVYKPGVLALLNSPLMSSVWFVCCILQRYFLVLVTQCDCKPMLNLQLIVVNTKLLSNAKMLQKPYKKSIYYLWFPQMLLLFSWSFSSYHPNLHQCIYMYISYIHDFSIDYICIYIYMIFSPAMFESK